MPFSTASRVSTFGTTIFAEMTALAARHNAINLSQGFPDFDGPNEVKTAAIAAIQSGKNQYALTTGQPDLRRAIADHARRFYNQAVNPETEVTVTSGATETLFAACLGLLNPGDEVILFEPFYDVYAPDVLMAGGVPRFLPLSPPDWNFDPDELASLFNNRTRAIIVNTPHNPTGKVFTRAELELIAALCQQWNVIAVTDEVYEHLVFDDAQHIRLATLPGMAERTVTISSQGKTFSFTGWKVGWAIAPPDLTLGIRRAHQFITFATATPFQHAAALALTLDDEYFTSLAADYQRKRDFLANVLRDAGLEVSVPAGTYFIMAGIGPLGFDDDVAFCRHLTTEVGVAVIPPSVFYSDDHKPLGKGYARFAFCKTMDTLERAAERLGKLKTSD
ncbi:MAG: aminotransferase class I/II-fold pyridoxal phosphate-dependent enzyme [Chloroflexi bacterium]|nr:aminotransferase class I/II-fold pyridoxal phosphate-dependent enzyme [Chloroflexota bacterium]